MGNLDTEDNTLAANIALSHGLHLLANQTQIWRYRAPEVIIPDSFANCKQKIQKNKKYLSVFLRSHFRRAIITLQL